MAMATVSVLLNGAEGAEEEWVDNEIEREMDLLSHSSLSSASPSNDVNGPLLPDAPDAVDENRSESDSIACFSNSDGFIDSHSLDLLQQSVDARVAHLSSDGAHVDTGSANTSDGVHNCTPGDESLSEEALEYLQSVNAHARSATALVPRGDAECEAAWADFQHATSALLHNDPKRFLPNEETQPLEADDIGDHEAVESVHSADGQGADSSSFHAAQWNHGSCEKVEQMSIQKCSTDIQVREDENIRHSTAPVVPSLKQADRNHTDELDTDDDPSIADMEQNHSAAKEAIDRAEQEAEERERLRQAREQERRRKLLHAAKEEAACRIIGRSALVWRRRRQQALDAVHRAAEEGTGSQLEAAAAAAEAFGCGHAADAARERWRAVREELRASLRRAAENGTVGEVERLRADAPRLGLNGEAAAADENLRRRRRAIEAKLNEEGPTEELRQQAYAVGASDALRSAEETQHATKEICEAAEKRGPRDLEEVIMSKGNLLKAETVATARQQMHKRAELARSALRAAANRGNISDVEQWLQECDLLELPKALRSTSEAVLSIARARMAREWSALTYASPSELRSAPINAEQIQNLPALQQCSYAAQWMLWPPRMQAKVERTITALSSTSEDTNIHEESDTAQSTYDAENEWFVVDEEAAAQGSARNAKYVSLNLTGGEAARQPDLTYASALKLTLPGPIPLGVIARAAPRLVDLRISGSGLKRADGLEKLHTLQHLDLSMNKLENVDSISSLVHLNTLLLNDNGLKTLPCMSNLDNLRTLDVSGNQLESIYCGLPAHSLQKLNVSKNALGTLTFPDLLKLEKLEAEGNSIAAVGSVVAPRLMVVDLMNNDLAAVQHAAPLAATSWGIKELSLSGNPCSSFQHYMQEVLGMIPTLMKLDGSPVPCTASWASACFTGLRSPAPPAKQALHMLAAKSQSIKSTDIESIHRDLTCQWAHHQMRRTYASTRKKIGIPQAHVRHSSGYFESVRAKKHNAALKIQCSIREFLARKRAIALRQKLAEQKRVREENAARQIQAMWRGIYVRKHSSYELDKRRRNDAARIVQAFARGWRVRLQIHRALLNAHAADDVEELEGIDMSELEMPEELDLELQAPEVSNLALHAGHEWADLLPETSDDVQDPNPRPRESTSASNGQQHGLARDASKPVQQAHLVEVEPDATSAIGNENVHGGIEAFDSGGALHGPKSETGASASGIDGPSETHHSRQQQQQHQSLQRKKRTEEIHRLMNEWGFTDERTAEAFMKSREHSNRKRREKEKKQRMDASMRLKRFQKVATRGS